MSANIVLVNEELLRKDIKNLVKKTVQETLNALLDEEAAGLVGAEHYVRTAGREAYRGGHYARKLVTGAGGVELSVPKLRGTTFRRPPQGYVFHVGVLACGVAASVGPSGDIEPRGIVGVH